jgi:hypothetical protein
MAHEDSPRVADAATELEERVRGVVAFNPYDYSEAVDRANRVASIYVRGARRPAIGPVVTRMENKPVLGILRCFAEVPVVNFRRAAAACRGQRFPRGRTSLRRR